MHKNIFTFVIVIALLPAMLLAGNGVITEFNADNIGGNCNLEWTIAQGSQVSKFNVHRSFDGTHFLNIGEVLTVRGVSKYSFTDDDLFKGELHTYYYRIDAVMTNRAIESSDVKAVRLSFSGITRTWGSIKAMFK